MGAFRAEGMCCHIIMPGNSECRTIGPRQKTEKIENQKSQCATLALMSNAELSDSIYAILRAAGELSREQAACDQDRERTTAPRDFAAGKVVSAFREFEAGAKAIKTPVRITVTLTPK